MTQEHKLIQFLLDNEESGQIKLSWTHLAAFPNQKTGGALGSFGNQSNFNARDYPFTGAGAGSQGPHYLNIAPCHGNQGPQGYYPPHTRECDGKCHVSICGSQGSSGSAQRTVDEKRTNIGCNYYIRMQPKPRTEMPETLEFKVEFVDQKLNRVDFMKLVDSLQQKDESQLQITYVVEKPIPREKFLKKGQEEILAEKQKAQDERRKTINDLMKMASDLGAVFEKFTLPPEKVSMPPEAYEERGEQKYTNPTVCILCRKTTNFYRAIDFAGLLQKYCPEPYRRGDSYSVNGGPLHPQPYEEVYVFKK